MAKSVSIADSPLHLPEYGDRLVSSYGSVSSPKFLLWSSTIVWCGVSKSGYSKVTSSGDRAGINASPKSVLT